MSSIGSHPARMRFGSFELDVEGKQLLENCKPLHITEQPLRVLVLLTAHAGRLVTRRELFAELWPQGPPPGADAALNSAIRRLRRVLGDEEGAPRYVEAVRGSGYRFIASVEAIPANGSGASAVEIPPTEPAAPAGPRHLAPGARWLIVGTAAALSLAVAGVLLRPEPVPKVLRIQSLTSSGGIDYMVEPATDGSSIYYLQRDGGHWDLMRTNSDGSPGPTKAAANTRVFDISAPGGEWLIGTFQVRGEPMRLWRQQGADGAPVPVGDISAIDALWAGDGQRIVYSYGRAIWSVNSDGSQRQKLLGLDDDATWMAWSPDRRRLRFTLTNAAGPSIWEWRRGAPAPILLGGQRCCGAWTGDGRYYLFSELDNGVWNMWAQREQPAWFGARRPRPVQLTTEPESAFGAFTGGRNGEAAFYLSQMRQEAERMNVPNHQFEPELPGTSVFQFNYSHDGRRVAYVDTEHQELWVADVTPEGVVNPRRLTAPQVAVAFPRWSPDDSSIAYGAITPDWGRQSYLIAAAGGTPRALQDEADRRLATTTTPDWSPDGGRIAVASTTRSQGVEQIVVVSLQGGHAAAVPGSNGLDAPRWSPDGRWLAAFSSDQHRLLVYDFTQSRWQTVARGTALTIPEWGNGGRYLYYQDLLADGEPLYRLQIGTWRRELVADFSKDLHSGLRRCGFIGLAPDGAPLISFGRAFSDLRLAYLDLP